MTPIATASLTRRIYSVSQFGAAHWLAPDPSGAIPHRVRRKLRPIPSPRRSAGVAAPQARRRGFDVTSALRPFEVGGGLDVHRRRSRGLSPGAACEGAFVAEPRPVPCRSIRGGRGGLRSAAPPSTPG